jgi:hypothetical protein
MIVGIVLKTQKNVMAVKIKYFFILKRKNNAMINFHLLRVKPGQSLLFDGCQTKCILMIFNSWSPKSIITVPPASRRCSFLRREPIHWKLYKLQVVINEKNIFARSLNFLRINHTKCILSQFTEQHRNASVKY